MKRTTKHTQFINPSPLKKYRDVFDLQSLIKNRDLCQYLAQFLSPIQVFHIRRVNQEFNYVFGRMPLWLLFRSIFARQKNGYHKILEYIPKLNMAKINVFGKNNPTLKMEAIIDVTTPDMKQTASELGLRCSRYSQTQHPFYIMPSILVRLCMVYHTPKHWEPFLQFHDDHPQFQLNYQFKLGFTPAEMWTRYLNNCHFQKDFHKCHKQPLNSIIYRDFEKSKKFPFGGPREISVHERWQLRWRNQYEKYMNIPYLLGKDLDQQNAQINQMNASRFFNYVQTRFPIRDYPYKGQEAHYNRKLLYRCEFDPNKQTNANFSNIADNHNQHCPRRQMVNIPLFKIFRHHHVILGISFQPGVLQNIIIWKTGRVCAFAELTKEHIQFLHRLFRQPSSFF